MLEAAAAQWMQRFGDVGGNPKPSQPLAERSEATDGAHVGAAALATDPCPGSGPGVEPTSRTAAAHPHTGALDRAPDGNGNALSAAGGGGGGGGGGGCGGGDVGSGGGGGGGGGARGVGDGTRGDGVAGGVGEGGGGGGGGRGGGGGGARGVVDGTRGGGVAGDVGEGVRAVWVSRLDSVFRCGGCGGRHETPRIGAGRGDTGGVHTSIAALGSSVAMPITYASDTGEGTPDTGGVHTSTAALSGSITQLSNTGGYTPGTDGGDTGEVHTSTAAMSSSVTQLQNTGGGNTFTQLSNTGGGDAGGGTARVTDSGPACVDTGGGWASSADTGGGLAACSCGVGAERMSLSRGQDVALRPADIPLSGEYRVNPSTLPLHSAYIYIHIYIYVYIYTYIYTHIYIYIYGFFFW